MMGHRFTRDKLAHVMPKLGLDEVDELNRFIKVLSKFDQGIYMDLAASLELLRILNSTKLRSQGFKEMMKISRLRLLRVLFTNKDYLSSFRLLRPGKGSTILYDTGVPLSIVAGVLVHLRKYHALELYMKCVVELDIDKLEKARFVRSVVKNLVHLDQIGMAFRYWYRYALMSYGHLDFNNVVRYTDTLTSVPLFTSHYDSQELVLFLKKFKELNQVSNHHFSMLISTFIFSLSRRNNTLQSIRALWDYKLSNNLSMVHQDLTLMMKSLQANQLNSEAMSLYNSHSDLHHDDQFDTLLRVHGSEHQWTSMQKQFEELFGRGELPNIRHYGIVMYALSLKGEMNALMLLWNQLQDRKMIPTLSIFHSLMVCSNVVKDYRGTISWFQKLPEYGLNYTTRSYSYLFKLLRGLRQLKVQLKFFKQLIYEDQVELHQECFDEIIMTCLELDDMKTAEFVFETLTKFDIQLSPKSEIVMMNLYNNRRHFNKVESKITTKISQGQPPSTEMYNQLLLRFLKTKEYSNIFELINKMRSNDISLDSHTYSYLARALVETKNPDQALKLFNRIPELLKVPQFNYLMNALYRAGYYKHVVRLYDKMIELKLIPDFDSYKHLINSLLVQYRGRRRLREQTLELAIKVVNTLLSDKANNNLKNPVVNLPFGLVYNLLNVLVRHDLDLCLSLFAEFYDSCQDKKSIEDDFRFSAISLKIHRRQGNDEEFMKIFQNYVELLESSFPIDPKTERVDRKSVSWKVRYLPQEFWPHILRIHESKGKLTEIPELLKSLTDKGFLFNNWQYNLTVVSLMKSRATMDVALSMAESKLMDGYIYLRLKRKALRLLARSHTTRSVSPVFKVPTFQNYLSGPSYIKLVQKFKKLLPKDTEARELTLREYTRKYPKFFKYFRLRSEVIDDWYRLLLKYRWGKKPRFANDKERQWFRKKETVRLRMKNRVRHERVLLKKMRRRNRSPQRDQGNFISRYQPNYDYEASFVNRIGNHISNLR